MTKTADQPQPVGIIYTGGTFGMVASAAGYTPSTDLPARAEHALLAAGDSNQERLPALRWIDAELGPPVNSSDITPSYWFRLASAIRAAASDCCGFVVIHGTDTLAYTGAALSFLLHDVDRPVVVTGARAPLGEPDSDALANLRTAILAAASGHTQEVTLAFAGRLLRANRASKRYGDRDTIFDSPHAEPLAEYGATLEWRDTTPPPDLTLPASEVHQRQVAMLAVYPGIDGRLIRRTAEDAAAVILEGYPAGVGPGGDAAFVGAIRDSVAAGVIVVAVPQSRYGRIQLGRYATSTPLADAGLIAGGDMTREAALAKLHWLLGTDLTTAAIADYFGSNLRGEISTDEAF